MEYLGINYKIKFNPQINYNFTCFDLIKENVNINYFYSYLGTEIEYKLKNIWNNIIQTWNQIISKKKYKQPNYNKYKYIHQQITHEELNDLFILFINKDKFKALFCLKCINDNIL